MKYKTIELSHTNEIIQTYGVNSLMAKVIESKKIDQKQFKSFMDPHLIYHDFSLFEEADETLAHVVLVSCQYCGAAPGVSDDPIPKAVCFWQRQLHRVPVPFRRC